jgi:diguanylate cyclase (GGDEF)-like protein
LIALKRRATDNTELPGATADSTPLPQDDEHAWAQRVLAFVGELHRTLSTAELHEQIAQRLPSVIDVEEIWIETFFDGRRKFVSSRNAAGTPSAHPLMEGPGEWATFPLRAAGTVVGIIGVSIAGRPLCPAARASLIALSPILGDTLQTAHTIAQLRELSTIDSMTGCANRPDGLERLRAELRRAQRSSQEVAILMLDLDYFKSINDRYGHACGDAVLAAIGHTLMQTLRVSDLRCRWGGEEFLVALPESGLDQAKRVAMTLARRIASTVTLWDSARIQLTTSIGITIAPPGDEDIEAILARADAALYRAKADGRNCIRVVLGKPQEGSPPLVSGPSPPPQRDRRNPAQADRRQFRGPGRRATDFAFRRPWVKTDVSDADEARVRAIPG